MPEVVTLTARRGVPVAIFPTLKNKKAFVFDPLDVIIKTKAFYWFPNLLLLKAALSRLDFGPAYYEDPDSMRRTRSEVKQPNVEIEDPDLSGSVSRYRLFASWTVGTISGNPTAKGDSSRLP
ncbi:unnamed protein product [Lupinus luteus]|uniref:Uncharacterized protein n=1 Tax=Lupinus luteus TaxID=3873 RepID=A0AAV1WX31_LUPLU